MSQSRIEKISVRLVVFGMLAAAIGGASVFVIPDVLLLKAVCLLGIISVFAGILYWRGNSDRSHVTPPTDLTGIAILLGCASVLVMGAGAWFMAYEIVQIAVPLLLIGMAAMFSAALVLLASTRVGKWWIANITKTREK